MMYSMVSLRGTSLKTEETSYETRTLGGQVLGCFVVKGAASADYRRKYEENLKLRRSLRFSSVISPGLL